MATARPRWRPFAASSSPKSAPSSASSSPSSSFTATLDPPEEFLCPVSGTLMADPVVVPPGRTVERACVQACAALGFYPPALAAAGLPPSSPLVLLPNVALRSAILNWCDRLGLPHPAPLPLDTAGDIVRRLMPRQEQRSSQFQYDHPRQEQRSSQFQYEQPPPQEQWPSQFQYEQPRQEQRPSQFQYEQPPRQEQRSSQFQYEQQPRQEQRPQSSYGRPPAGSVRTRRSSVSSDDFLQEPMQRSGSMEEEIMAVLGAADGASAAELKAAMASLRQATRESKETRTQLCTPRLLAALRPMLLSGDADLQVNAAAAMVNLSLEAENKLRIVRSGAVSPLVDVLRVGHPEARDHAAGAIYSLAVEDENRAAIGVLGAIPPLLELFASGGAGHRARREAGMALYHVSLADMNRSKIARTPGVVRTLLATAEARDRGNDADAEAAALRKLSVMILANLAGCPEGRAALMDGGAVAAVVRLMRSGAVVPGSSEEEYCISALYGMSKGSLRFRGLARAGGVEDALAPVAECDSGGGVGRDMARRTLRAMRGEDDEAAFTASGILGSQWGDASVVSEGMVSLRRPPHHRGGNHAAGTAGSNTTQF